MSKSTTKTQVKPILQQNMETFVACLIYGEQFQLHPEIKRSSKMILAGFPLCSLNILKTRHIRDVKFPFQYAKRPAIKEMQSILWPHLLQQERKKPIYLQL